MSLRGHWTLADAPSLAQVASEIESGAPISRVVVDSAGLLAWDSSLMSFLFALADLASRRGLELETAGLPNGAQKLLRLSRAVPAHTESRAPEDDAFTARVGRITLTAWGTAGDALEFLGETALALGRTLGGRARFGRAELVKAMEQAGPGALGIVSLISFLVGAVLAFVGAVQLQQFGATAYVANLVAIGITRELGALMTGIVMAGRTGAAFAAVLGTMTLNEEVDALQTMGLRASEFLVLPRVIGTALMMPALVLYADLLGILGGAFVGVVPLDVGAFQYFRQTQSALELRHFVVGLAKSVAFGAVVALTGCYYGIRCGRNAAAVGRATTSAVVVGIVLLVVVDSIFTVLLHFLHV